MCVSVCEHLHTRISVCCICYKTYMNLILFCITYIRTLVSNKCTMPYFVSLAWYCRVIDGSQSVIASRVRLCLVNSRNNASQYRSLAQSFPVVCVYVYTYILLFYKYVCFICMCKYIFIYIYICVFINKLITITIICIYCYPSLPYTCWYGGTSYVHSYVLDDTLILLMKTIENCVMQKRVVATMSLIPHVSLRLATLSFMTWCLACAGVYRRLL